MKILELKNITKIYGKGDSETKALAGVDLTIEKGDFCAIMGPSGSGKSTLLNILGCMDTPTSGEYILKGQDVSKMMNTQYSTTLCYHLTVRSILIKKRRIELTTI